MVSFLREKILYLSHHRFVKNVLTLQAGNFIGNIFQALINIVVARLLQPELFGVFVIAYSLASLMSIVLSAGVQDAVASVLGRAYAQKDGQEIKEAFAFFLKITLVTSVVALVEILFAPPIARHFYHDANIGIYAGVIVLGAILSTYFYSFSLLILQVLGKIKSMSVLMVGDLVIRNSLSLFLVWKGYGLLGASAGHFIGAFILLISSIFIWESVRKQYPIFPPLIELIKHVKKASIRKYLKFSAWVAIDRNISMLYGILPVLLGGLFISSSEVTFFKLAFGYVNLALALLGPISILLNVEFPRIIVESGHRLRTNFIKVTAYSLALAFVLTAGALLVAPFAFKFFYGESFLPSIKYSFALFLYGIIYGLGVGLGPMWRALNKVKVSIIINTATLVVGIPLGVVFIKNFGAYGVIAMVTLWFTVSHVSSFLYLAKKLKNT